MATQKTSIVDLVLRYDALMQRYAGFILRNGFDTSGIVKEAFETYYAKYSAAPPERVKELLRREVLYACHYCMKWLQHSYTV